MAQAEKSKYYFRDQVFRPAFDGHVPFTFGSAVWFTAGDRNLVSGNLPLSYKEETTLWANDLASVKQVQNAINRVYKYHDVYCANPSEKLIKKTLDLLAPEFNKEHSYQSTGNETLFHVMTKEQNLLLDYLDEQQTAAIRGAAGMGKTITAIEKAKANKVLFTTVRKFKGLEADAVICIDIDEDTFSNDENRNLFYVWHITSKRMVGYLTAAPQEALTLTTVFTDADIPRNSPQAVKAIRDALRVKIGTSGNLEERLGLE